MAFNSLRSNKTRTFLTLLGIIIGVMSVTTIIGLGEGVKKQVNQQINDLGNDLVTVVPGRNSSISGLEGLNNVFGNSATTARLSEADLVSISKIAGVTKAGGTMQLDGSITRGNNKKNTRVLAVGEDYLDLTKQKLQVGQFFGGDLENNNTVVIADNVAKDLFGSEDPIGSTVTIRETPFVVIGVLDAKKGFNLGQSLDDMVLIPMPTGKTFNQDIVQLQQITAKVADPSKSEAVSATIKQELLKNHAGEEDFAITTQEQLVETTDYVFKVITGFTAAVALKKTILSLW